MKIKHYKIYGNANNLCHELSRTHRQKPGFKKKEQLQTECPEKLNLCKAKKKRLHRRVRWRMENGEWNVVLTNQTLVIRSNVVINTVTMSLPALLVDISFAPPRPVSFAQSRFWPHSLINAAKSLSMACQFTCLHFWPPRSPLDFI